MTETVSEAHIERAYAIAREQFFRAGVDTDGITLAPRQVGRGVDGQHRAAEGNLRRIGDCDG